MRILSSTNFIIKADLHMPPHAPYREISEAHGIGEVDFMQQLKEIIDIGTVQKRGVGHTGRERGRER